MSAKAGARGGAALVEGRYRLAREVGRGDCARVFAAEDVLLGTDVAVKVLKGLDPDSGVSRALRAARAAGKVVDRRVVPVLDVASGELPFLTLPLYDVRPLATILQRGALRPELALALADDILGGLAAIHASGGVHRDVRAENVLVGVDGTARLTSAGLTRAAADPVLGLRVDEEVASPAFPARTTAGRLSDPRHDVAEAAALLRPLLGDLVDERVDEVLRTAGHAEPRRRYIDAAAFKEALSLARQSPARPGPGRTPGAGRAPGAAGSSGDHRQPSAGGYRPGASEPEPPDPATMTMRLGLRGPEAAAPGSPPIGLPPAAFGPPEPPVARRAAALVVIGVVVLVVVGLLASRPPPSDAPASAVVVAPRPQVSAEEFVAEEPALVPGVDAPRLPGAQDPRPALSDVLAGAEGADAEAAQDVADRLEGLDALGPAERAAEIAELYGGAALALANDEDWGPFAEQVAAYLRPELSPMGVLALAGRGPEAIDPFVRRLLDGLEQISGLDAAGQRAAAEELLGELEVTVSEETVAPEFAAATAEVLLRAAELEPPDELEPAPADPAAPPADAPPPADATPADTVISPPA